jgi:selenocysteine lyase/cysteine desulfurase
MMARAAGAILDSDARACSAPRHDAGEVAAREIHSDILCRILSDSFKIMTRSGFHCAHPLFDWHGFSRGALRLSAYLYNTVEQIHAAGEVLAVVLGRVSRT